MSELASKLSPSASSEPGAATGEFAIGPAAEIPPGKQKVVQVGKHEIGVFNVGGTFYALQNVCPHQFGPLCEGRIGGEMICNAGTRWKFEWRRDGEIVTCPWHGLEFDLTTGRCLAPKEFQVRQFDVRVVDGELRLSLVKKKAAAPSPHATPS